jgi:hypothetical protein
MNLLENQKRFFYHFPSQANLNPMPYSYSDLIATFKLGTSFAKAGIRAESLNIAA